jgi:hypothetical protein
MKKDYDRSVISQLMNNQISRDEGLGSDDDEKIPDVN